MKKNKYTYLNITLVLFLAMFGFKTVVYGLNCDSWGEVRTDIQNVFNFVKILIPLLIIGLSSFDFIKAVAGKDEKDMKKAFQALIKRLALAIVFFFLPVFLNLILDLFETHSSVCIE